MEFPGLDHGASSDPSTTNPGGKPEIVAQVAREVRSFFATLDIHQETSEIPQHRSSAPRQPRRRWPLPSPRIRSPSASAHPARAVVRYLGLGDAAARRGQRRTTGPNWSDGFTDQTVRQVIRVTGGGRQVRVRLSNLYGTGPLQVTGATIARTRDGATVEPGTVRSLTFHGARSATIQTGRIAASDPAALPVSPLESLTDHPFLRRLYRPVDLPRGRPDHHLPRRR